MTKIVFILNPISGGGDTKDIFERKVKKIDDWYGWTYQIIYTERIGHATELAYTYSTKVDYVVAVGGDGTVHEVAKGLAGTNATLAIIPMGSGNGVARSLKIPVNIDKAILYIKNGFQKKIDTLSVNDEFLLGVGGAGFDAHIAHEFDKATSRGLKTYTKISMKEFFKFKALEYEFEINSMKKKGKAFLFVIANSNQWGNNFYISPKSYMMGGEAKLIIIENTSKWNLILLLPALLTKTILKLPFVKSYNFHDMKFKINNNIFHIDGEPKKIYGEQHTKVIKNNLKVCFL